MNQSSTPNLNLTCWESSKNNNSNRMNLKLYWLLSGFLIQKERATFKLNKWKGSSSILVLSSEKRKLRILWTFQPIRIQMLLSFTMKTTFQGSTVLWINTCRMWWKVMPHSKKRSEWFSVIISYFIKKIYLFDKFEKNLWNQNHLWLIHKR